MVEPGLTDDEIAGVEDTFGFEFADDHRAFLVSGLPVGAAWPDWRNEGRRSLAKRLQLPVEGVLFAVEWGRFWHDGWGLRLAQMKHALRTAKYELERVPQLVPLCSHHYLPAGRGSSGHPVLSVVRTEVVVSAANLADYVGGKSATPAAPSVEFWSDLVSR
jgi:hypothetical protein